MGVPDVGRNDAPVTSKVRGVRMTVVLRLVLVAATAFVMVGLPLVVPLPGLADQGPAISTTVAASPALDNGNDNGGQTENDNRDESQIEGTILPVACPDESGEVAQVCGGVQGITITAINRTSSPPEIYVHNVDGPVRVTFRDAASLDQFQEGQYVRIDGRRLDAFLFEADSGDIDIVQGPALRPDDNGNSNGNGNGNDNGNSNRNDNSDNNGNDNE